MTRCPMCGGLGWVLDCNDLSKAGPRMVEFIACFYPECTISGQPVQSVAFQGVEFQHASLHLTLGHVMSVSQPRPEPLATARLSRTVPSP